jgi:peptidyl-prolyl cis-trans isomerase C
MSSSMSGTATVIRRPGGSTERRSSALVYPLLREPFFHFLLLGALIFAVSHVVQSERSASDRQIVVDEQLQQRIVEINQTQSGVTPGREQLERLVDEYIDDEVMYREAMRLGLDRDDEIVRRRLIQKMQFLRRDLAAAPKPDAVALRAYYDTHPQLFNSPARVSFEQLYFSADRGGWGEAEARAQRAHDQLAHVTASAVPLDDAFPFQIPPAQLTRIEAGQLFGDTPIIDALFGAPQGQWSDPVRSAYGWHLIKVGHRRISSLAPFSDVPAQVQSAYLQEQSQAAERRELDTLRARYEIVRPGTRSKGSP